MRTTAPAISIPALVLLATLGLSSCGVVEQGSGAGGAGGDSSSSVLGQRAVPGYILTVERLSEVSPGRPCAVRVTVAPDAGQAAATGLEARVGTAAYDSAATSIAGTAASGVANAYDLRVDLPTSLPADAVVWVRFTTADGAVIEAGRDAFPLVAR